MSEYIDDDGSHTLTVGVVSDVEIRLTIASSLAQNEQVSKWTTGDQLGLADMWVKYVKTGEVEE